jgi:prepilin-type N-terminal cleavage/methylation domain-containing protein
MTLTERGFTLIELMVVIAMIAIFMTAVGTSVGKTRERAREERARSDVKAIAQAILAWENYEENNQLEEIDDAEVDASNSKIKMLFGGETAKSGDVPVLLMAAFNEGGKMCDPWGKPYYIRIKGGSIMRPKNRSLNLKTCFFIPNLYRLSAEERQ